MTIWYRGCSASRFLGPTLGSDLLHIAPFDGLGIVHLNPQKQREIPPSQVFTEWRRGWESNPRIKVLQTFLHIDLSYWIYMTYVCIDTGLGPHWDQIVHVDIPPQTDRQRFVVRVSSANPPHITGLPVKPTLDFGNFNSCSGIPYGLESTWVLLLAFRNLRLPHSLFCWGGSEERDGRHYLGPSLPGAAGGASHRCGRLSDRAPFPAIPLDDQLSALPATPPAQPVP